jgi:hypothetical protein
VYAVQGAHKYKWKIRSGITQKYYKHPNSFEKKEARGIYLILATNSSRYTVIFPQSCTEDSWGVEWGHESWVIITRIAIQRNYWARSEQIIDWEMMQKIQEPNKFNWAMAKTGKAKQTKSWVDYRLKVVHQRWDQDTRRLRLG